MDNVNEENRVNVWKELWNGQEEFQGEGTRDVILDVNNIVIIRGHIKLL